METLQITKENAVKAYKEGNEKQKALLINLFGEKHFQLKITDRVKTFEDACEVLGYAVPKSMHVVDKLKVIAEALNEGWKPDWNDSSQPKYVPWFKWNGTKFVCDGYNCWSSVTFVGSRLCFSNSALAIYIATQFEDLYNKFLQ